MAANSFLYVMTPIYMGATNANDRVASPESVSTHLKLLTSTVAPDITAALEQSDQGLQCLLFLFV